MFKKRRCLRCGENIKASWYFCPYCGAKLKGRIGVSTNIFEDIEKEFERIDKVFSESFFKFPSLRTKPYRSGGITIRIESVGGKEPKIEIRTTGEYKKLEPEIKKRLGMKPAIQEVKERKIRVPKVTEEPETKIKTIGNKQIITVKLPGVKSEDDIEIRRLEQSIEIKAFVNNKAYFTLIPIPKKAVISKKFKEGVLKIEIRK